MIDSMEGESPSVSQHQTGWKRIKNALHFSLEGLRACYTGEEAFRQEVWLTTFQFLSIVLPISALSTALLIASVLLVMIVEILNSAVEAVVDRISKDHHLLQKGERHGQCCCLSRPDQPRHCLGMCALDRVELNFLQTQALHFLRLSTSFWRLGQTKTCHGLAKREFRPASDCNTVEPWANFPRLPAIEPVEIRSRIPETGTGALLSRWVPLLFGAHRRQSF